MFQRARSLAAGVTRSVRSAAGRIRGFFTRRRSARREPAAAAPVPVEEYLREPNVEAVPHLEIVLNRAPSPPSPPRRMVNQIALEARLQKLNNPRRYNPPRPPVSARAPRAPTVPGGIASNQGMAIIAARTAARAAAAAHEAAAREAARQRAILEETIDGIARLTPRNFKRLVWGITFAAFERLHPVIHEAIVTRVSSDLNHDEFIMIRPDVRLLMSERAEQLGLSLP